MSVTTPTFRLKVASGDTGLVDKKGTAGSMTGTATQTLIDRGSGEYAMRVASGELSITIPTRSIVANSAGSGFSWIMDVQIENFGSTEYLDLMNIGSGVIATNASGNSPNGVAMARYGDGYVYFPKDDSTAGPRVNTGNTKHTIGFRLNAAQSTGSQYWTADVWVDGVKYPGGVGGYGSNTLNTLTINASSGLQLNIRDMGIYPEELSDANMQAATTNFRATVDVVNNPPTFSGTIANIAATSGTAISTVDVHSYFSDTDTLTYSASPAGTAWPSGLVINSSTGVISGTPSGSATGLKVRATDTGANTVDSNAFNVTVSAGSSGATAVTMAGPNSGQVSAASTNFTVGANGTITGTVVVTPSDGGAGGTFTPTTVSLTSASPTGTFTYTPSSAGAKTISVTNNGSLTNPNSITYTASSTVSYIDMGVEKCDHIQNGILASVGLSAVVWRRDDLNVAKQVVTGITSNADGTVPRFSVTFPVGTPVHVAFISTADNTASGLASDHVTVS